MDAQKIGKLIYELRTEKKLTQKELAKKINVTDKAVSKWECGDGCPDVSVMPILAKELGILVEDLMNGNTPSKEKVYTKEEIEKILGVKQPKVLVYDWARCDVLDRENLYKIFDLSKKIAEKFSSEFTALLERQILLNVTSADEITDGEFIRYIPNPDYAFFYAYGDKDFWVEVSPNVGKFALKQDIQTFPEIQKFDLIALHELFIKKIASEFYKSFYEDSNQNNKLDFSFEDFEITNPQMTNCPRSFYRDYSPVGCMISFECKSDPQKHLSGMINFHFGHDFINRLYEMQFFKRPKTPKNNMAYLTKLNEDENQSNLFVEFGRFKNDSLTFANGFEKGQVLIMDKKHTDPLEVIYKNQVIHTGFTCVVDEKFSVQILEDKIESPLTYDDKDYISVRLGSTNLTDGEIKNLSKESVVQLGTLVGQFFPIIKNGVKVALGEILVIDGMFAVKIMEV